MSRYEIFAPDIRERASLVLDQARAKSAMIATAESCTGGLIAASLTDIAGSSDVVDRGFVTYSNEAKADMLGVGRALIASQGAVSEAVVRAMAQGAIKSSNATLSVAVTGIAGPNGGSPEKPVGLVHLATAQRGGGVHHSEQHFGDIGRIEIRIATVICALELLLEALQAG